MYLVNNPGDDESRRYRLKDVVYQLRREIHTAILWFVLGGKSALIIT